MTTETTERDLVEEVEELLAKTTPGPNGIDGNAAAKLNWNARDYLRRLVEEVKRLRGQYKSAVSDFAVEINGVRAQLALVYFTLFILGMVIQSVLR